MNLTYKILSAHRMSGELSPGAEIGIRIDQTLTQDATGTMAYLQFEAMGLPRVRTKLSVSYVDHNMLQTGFENADDHRYLQSVAERYGIVFSRPGNGICHQVHRERFAVPGQTLLGSDSHTPTCGGLGMLAMGAGGLDVAVAMAGEPYFIPTPRVLGVKLTGRLQPWCSGKDVILEMLRRLSVKGGTGRIVEYTGPGVASLSASHRFTITNMGAELGATTSIFPSDEITRHFLSAQGREDAWVPLAADPDASYDELVEIDLDALEPLIACPSSPDNVVSVRSVAGTPVVQVCIGSCTNSSYEDLATAALMLRGRRVHPDVSMTVTPGSKQVFEMIVRDGYFADLIAAGCRILESSCGPCIGMGQAPPTGGVSVRSFNRNFKGRSGTSEDLVYLASPEVCVACALTGQIADPRDLAELAPIAVATPEHFLINDNMLVFPPADGQSVEVERGPNIKPVPLAEPVRTSLEAPVLLKLGDNISTDHIMPAGAKVLPLRSNIPAISEFVFMRVDPTFPERARSAGQSIVVGGSNYGQGSSREHAALAPMYLGVRAVLVKSFARIHRANLVNFGILPLTFADEADYDGIEPGDQLRIDGVLEGLAAGELRVSNLTQKTTFTVKAALTEREREVILAGGLLNKIKSEQAEAATV
ncbi:aconitate hydratase [Gloeobacter kilaueensis]|uniref:Aconitate hydratase n=1 Tax=Gloeobacter kilaueensis (strain ATCC BAA-2537 / CCAP 1431/1 / ULC 316 / JS1) TaxID=1183438 RepID=U5QGF2_GLOK1|nr:aconitate hydratase [Gloeobacter kilaueensis]AGY58047.1 aconitate hydratase [Gloeobacter kilaueensis JS1]